MTLDDLKNRSLNDVENLYRLGVISEILTSDYIRAWNQGPHLTQAVLFDGRIRTFDPESSRAFYGHLTAQFAIRWE